MTQRHRRLRVRLRVRLRRGARSHLRASSAKVLAPNEKAKERDQCPARQNELDRDVGSDRAKKGERTLEPSRSPEAVETDWVRLLRERAWAYADRRASQRGGASRSARRSSSCDGYRAGIAR